MAESGAAQADHVSTPTPKYASATTVERLVRSPLPLYRAARAILCLAAAILGSDTIRKAVSWLDPVYIHQKDLFQEYLLGRAVIERVNPYLPLSELVSRLVGTLPHQYFSHPTPHPPPVVLLSLPLAALTFQQAAGVWLILQAIWITTSVWLILRATGAKSSALIAALWTITLLGTDAYLYEMVLAQLQSLILLLFVLAWLAFRRGREWAGGAALGVALSLKLMGWLFVPLLMVQRRWRAVVSAVVVPIILNGLAAILMGPTTIIDYYMHVGPEIAASYRSDPWNLSLWTVGWRFFEGTGTTMLSGITAAPLIRWPMAARILSVLIPAAIAAICVFEATRMPGFDGAFALLACAGAILNPIAWTHYNVLATMALVWVWRRLWEKRFPRSETWAATVISVALYVRITQYHGAALALSGQKVLPGMLGHVPFAASLITLLPTAAVMGLMYLVWRVDRLASHQAQAPAPMEA